MNFYRRQRIFFSFLFLQSRKCVFSHHNETGLTSERRKPERDCTIWIWNSERLLFQTPCTLCKQWGLVPAEYLTRAFVVVCNCVAFVLAFCFQAREWDEIFLNSNYLARIRQTGINGRMQSISFQSGCWKGWWWRKKTGKQHISDLFRCLASIFLTTSHLFIFPYWNCFLPSLKVHKVMYDVTWYTAVVQNNKMVHGNDIKYE